MQGLANVVWGFARLEVVHFILFRAVAVEAARRDVQKVDTQDIAHLCWAFATVDRRHADIDQLFRRMSIASRHHAQVFSVLGLVNTAWAFASMYSYSLQRVQ